MSYKDLLRRYQAFDRTRLFDADWNITQQWTTVNVPWSADYLDTKFSITLTKKSPVVIVLSQVRLIFMNDSSVLTMESWMIGILLALRDNTSSLSTSDLRKKGRRTILFEAMAIMT